MAATQDTDEELQALRDGPMVVHLAQQRLPESPQQLWCDRLCGTARLYVPRHFVGLPTPPLPQAPWHLRDARHYEQVSGAATDEKGHYEQVSGVATDEKGH